MNDEIVLPPLSAIEAARAACVRAKAKQAEAWSTRARSVETRLHAQEVRNRARETREAGRKARRRWFAGLLSGNRPQRASQGQGCPAEGR